MPKHGFLTPKAIANRIKSKGLQKLRWYCQMCQKQCRDENGFKCHTMSESHQRQLLLFADNPDKYIDGFSKDFLDDFILLLSRRFGTKRVHANQVYQEYISDRNHLHMNATQWETLTEFVKWLGRAGHCTVDETEKGWFVTYIDRDPETIQRQNAVQKSEKMKRDDEERSAMFFQRQMERDKEKSSSQPESVYTELVKDEDEKIAFNMKASQKPQKVLLDIKKNPLSASTSKSGDSKPSNDKSKADKKRKMALEEIIEEEKRFQQKKNNRKECWLVEGIIVKIVSNELKDFYKKKAVVRSVKDNLRAVIKLLDTGEKVPVYQHELETVIPAIGRKVLILNGIYRGAEATLLDVNFDKFCCKIKISSGTFKGKVLESVKYEDISKLDVES